MNTDPLYLKIEEALKRPLEGNRFQACAVAILGKAHPNLAPMPGGDDAGMDGAFGTPSGPFPLVCTVTSKVLGNFRKNMLTHLAKGAGPKCAIVATSQRLSNRKKRNLHAEAEKLGVTIEDHEIIPANLDSIGKITRFVQHKKGDTGGDGEPSRVSDH